ncbi:hypothetical protein [Shumkonia mesophila]|uniref:hypothetical protein n=1 Tax=Shumkonia mesophila TaxID=2838854 RepID=UPI002934BD17|nr:hypothetical protein [Shumkonia mesophila]
MTDGEKPAQKLAALIVDRLVKEGLLRAEKRDQLAAKIAAGTMKESDWNLDIDLASREGDEK